MHTCFSNTIRPRKWQDKTLAFWALGSQNDKGSVVFYTAECDVVDGSHKITKIRVQISNVHTCFKSNNQWKSVFAHARQTQVRYLIHHRIGHCDWKLLHCQHGGPPTRPLLGDDNIALSLSHSLTLSLPHFLMQEQQQIRSLAVSDCRSSLS